MTTSWSGTRQPIPKATRKRILQRDDYRCQLCQGTRCGNHPLHVDHRVPVAEGGTHDDTNLWALGAYPCHAEKTRAEQARGRARRATTRITVRPATVPGRSQPRGQHPKHRHRRHRGHG